MLHAVIFDIDGTLLDTERIYIRAWKAAGMERGYTISDDLMIRTRGTAAGLGRRMMLEELGADFPYPEIQARRVELAEELIAREENLLKPGALALLQELMKRRIPFAAATSTGKEHTRAHLRAAGLDSILTKRITGDMVARGKPDPDIFLQAASLLDVSPEDALVVEDSRAGLAAAAAAGMKAVWIPDLSSNPTPGRAACFRQYTSLYGLVDELALLLGEADSGIPPQD